MNEWINKQNLILNWWIDIKLISKLKVIIYFIYLILFKNDIHINNQ